MWKRYYTADILHTVHDVATGIKPSERTEAIPVAHITRWRRKSVAIEMVQRIENSYGRGRCRIRGPGAELKCDLLFRIFAHDTICDRRLR